MHARLADFVWFNLDFSQEKGENFTMRISDLIEEFIKGMLEDESTITLQRNDLAEQFNCVPSQINYVIQTRFTPIQGYYVESQRGGGGYIKIERVNMTKSNYLMHIITSIGNTVTAKEIDIFVNNFLDNNIINEKEAKLIRSATNEKVLALDQNVKDKIRARIFKNMLITLV